MGSGRNAKKTLVYLSAGVIAVTAAAVAYWVGFSMSPVHNPGANATDGASKLDLDSITAYDSSHSLIGKVEPNQSFKVNQAVFVQANFSSQNTDEYILVSEIRGPNGTSVLSTVQGTIAGSGYLSVEIYWRPVQIGDYDLLVFHLLPEELTRGPVVPPVAMIPLKVVE
ncbi:MAG: hypothetical protein ACREBU_02200 [Nitrososphaera sp.]